MSKNKILEEDYQDLQLENLKLRQEIFELKEELRLKVQRDAFMKVKREQSSVA